MTDLRCRELYLDGTRRLLLVETVESNIKFGVWLSYCSFVVDPVAVLDFGPDGIEVFDLTVGSISIASLKQKLPQIDELLASFDETIATLA